MLYSITPYRDNPALIQVGEASLADQTTNLMNLTDSYIEEAANKGVCYVTCDASPTLNASADWTYLYNAAPTAKYYHIHIIREYYADGQVGQEVWAIASDLRYDNASGDQMKVLCNDTLYGSVVVKTDTLVIHVTAVDGGSPCVLKFGNKLVEFRSWGDSAGRYLAYRLVDSINFTPASFMVVVPTRNDETVNNKFIEMQGEIDQTNRTVDQVMDYTRLRFIGR